MNRQMRIEDFVFPFGQLDKNNEWVKLADLVPWDEADTKTRLKALILSGLNCARMRYLPCWASAQPRHLPFLAQFILGNLLKLSIRF